METNINQIKQGLEATLVAINSLHVAGIENCKNITMAYNNIDVILRMVNSGELTLANVDEKSEKKSTMSSKK